MLVLYAVVPAGHEETRSAGLHRLDGNAVGVAFEDRADQPGTERADVVRYGRKLVELAGRAPILPMRYGTVVSSPVELAELLTAREEQWRCRLDEVAGHREMLVHLAATAVRPEDVRTARSGREYLLDRARELREERAIAQDLSRAVAVEVTEIRGLATRGGERRLACLVPEHRISEFQDAVEGWSRLRQEHVWCTGPWPPFSFAEEVERD